MAELELRPDSGLCGPQCFYLAHSTSKFTASLAAAAKKSAGLG